MRTARRTLQLCVVGGGTGTFSVLRGLKQAFADARISAIVPVSDSGGSTGRLRDAFGVLPVGDARAALVALADEEGEPLLRELFTHRFATGEGLAGHNLGNLLLLALTQRLGSEFAAIQSAGRILRVRGSVIPVSREKADLVARYRGGAVVRGEALISEPTELPTGPIEAVWLEPEVQAAPEVVQAIEEADAIIIGPGDLYTSLIANLLVRGIPEAILSSRGVFVAIGNLMTRRPETHAMSAAQHIREIARYAGRVPDVVVQHAGALPKEALALYAREEEFPVEDDLAELEKEDVRVVRADVANVEIARPQEGDAMRRSLIRHSPEKVAAVVRELLRGKGVVE
ncbi:YvcK family protein [Candidatus Parcubacteria bacterium]|nr:MAG: YvcK family protein [Candidatus Parcubacteria bacterium]